MFERLIEARELLESVVAALEPELLEGRSAERLVAEFSRIEKLAAAGKGLAARRVAESGAWRRGGDRSPAHWMARTTGTTVGQAAASLQTADQLKELPETEQAFRRGRLSETQAKEVASAAAASPSSEADLLRAAVTEGSAGLRERCRQVRAAAVSDENARHDALHRSRYLRHWSDHDGAFRLDGRFTPEDGAVVLAALHPHRQRLFEEARAAGRRERPEAYAADALVALSQNVECAHPKAMVQVRVDATALARGHTEGDETCEIDDVGPVPVSAARTLMSDAFLTAVVSDGVDVTTVARMGRTVPAHVRTALVARDRGCVVPGCEARHRLEIDHIVPLAEGGPTALANLARLCGWHHHLKTYRGYRLSGGPGRWCWEAPGEEAPHSGDPPRQDGACFSSGTLSLL